MEQNFFYDGKKIAKFEEKRIIVDKAFKTIKSAGIEKVILTTAESVAAFSEKRTCRITGKKLCYKVHNARFTLKSSTLPCPSKTCPVTTSYRHTKVFSWVEGEAVQIYLITYGSF